jgi:DNA-binding MarR family transcriptional regulator
MFKIDDSRFYTVFYWMTKYLKLKGAELIVFAIVFGYSQDKASEFYGSLGYMEELGNLSRPTVVAALDSLEKKGYVKRREFLIGKIKRVAYSTNTDKINELLKNMPDDIPPIDKPDS